MIKVINAMVAPLRNRIANMVSRAVVQLVDDSMKMQLLQLSILSDETREKCERVQNYGVSSHPVPGAEAVVLFVGGRRDHGLVVAVDDRRHRIKDLAEGEAALYNGVTGAYILMKADGTIEVQAQAGQSIVLNGGVLNVARVTDTAGPYPIVGGNPFVKA